jgi:sulfate transport system permease protein
LGVTVTYLSLIVLLPLAALLAKSATAGWDRFFAVATSPRAVAALELSFGGALAGAAVNSVGGFIVAWVLVRYEFPGRRLIDALVDLPFAMPTAVSGIALAAIYAPTGWVGRWFADADGNAIIPLAYSRIGVVIALTFISVPFVVRTLQPALQELAPEIEEAAASLGASRLATFRRLILPTVFPAMLTGFALAVARAVGEYGSVVFIAGNKPMDTEIAPLLIMMKLDEFDYAGATVIATEMLALSFVMLLTINLLQAWATRRLTGGR